MEEDVENYSIKQRDEFVRSVIRVGNPEKEPQMVLLLKYLESLGDEGKAYIRKLMQYDEVAFMNMKILSEAIIYYVKFRSYTPDPNNSESSLDNFLADRYVDIVYDVFNEKGKNRSMRTYKSTESILSDENKLNIKINMASYLNFLKSNNF